MRLFPSLGDLSFSIEVNKSDIVASAAAPESLLPHGGTVIWVKPDAEVVCYGDQINTVAARPSPSWCLGCVVRLCRGDAEGGRSRRGAEGPAEHPLATARDEFVRILYVFEL